MCMSQNPTQPKGIGDVVELVVELVGHKTPPSRKALET